MLPYLHRVKRTTRSNAGEGQNPVDDFAARLKQLRLERKLAVEEAANMLMPRTTGRTWSKWENRREEPKLANFRSLCRFFNVSGNYLLGWPEGPPSEFTTGEDDELDQAGALTGVAGEDADLLSERQATRQPKPKRPGPKRRP